MNVSNHGRKSASPVNRSQVARIVFDNAAAMGIRDRKLVEKLTSQVIERLEKARAQALPTLPGMENLVDQRSRQVYRGPMPTEAEIEAMVMEVLNAEKPEAKPISEPTPVQKEEVEAEMETDAEVKTAKETLSPNGLTDTALHVLEKRYLQRDNKGKVIETPEEMFRRVAKAIAAAELVYDPGANTKAIEDGIVTAMVFHPSIFFQDVFGTTSNLRKLSSAINNTTECLVSHQHVTGDTWHYTFVVIIGIVTVFVLFVLFMWHTM